MKAPVDTFEATDRKLRRSLSFQQLLFFNLGGIIGSGWLFAVLAADAIAGPAVVVAWVIGGILVLLVALTYAEMAGALPRSGAIVRYPHYTHGGYAGFILAWSYFLAAVTVTAIEAEGVITYASTYIHGLTTTVGKVTVLTGPGILLAIGLMLVFFLVNYFGVRLLGRWNQVFTWWKLIIPTLTFILLFAVFHASNYTAYGGVAPLGFKAVLLAIGTGGIVFAYLGFRQGLDFGGEAKNPQRDVPLATILSVVIATLLYTLLQLAFTGALNWSKAEVAPGHWSALAGSHWAKGPFYDALSQSGVPLLGAFASLLLVDAVISPSGTGWIFLGTSSRVLYGMAMTDYLPRPLRWINDRFRVPWVALVASLVIGCLFFLPLPSWYLLVGFISSALVITTLTGGISLEVLRRTAPDLHRPFKLPAVAILAPAGTLAAMLMVYWSGFHTLTELVAAIFVGLPLYAWFYGPLRGYMRTPAGIALGVVFLVVWIATQVFGPMDRHTLSFGVFFALDVVEVLAFTGVTWLLSTDEGRLPVSRVPWLLFLIFGTYLVSYLGAYGPLTRPIIPFPWDNVVVLAISLIGFYWGVASGYQTEEIRRIVDSGTAIVPEEPEARQIA